MALPRVQPLTGPDAARRLVAAAGLIKPSEVHSTNDQFRLFLQNYHVAPVHHSDVASEAAMYALNTSESRGCWPADTCYRTDTGTLWLCIGNNGEASADWLEISAGGSSSNIVDGGDEDTEETSIIDGGAYDDEFVDEIDGDPEPF